MALRILQEGKKRNVFVKLWFAVVGRRQAPGLALAPSVLSGLCSMLNDHQLLDDNSIKANNEKSRKVPSKSKKITVTSSDLVLYCQNLRHQSLRELHKRRRSRKVFFFVILPLILFVPEVGLFFWRSFVIHECLTKLGYAGSDVVFCKDQPGPNENETCRWMDVNLYDIFYDDLFRSPASSLTEISSQCHRQHHYHDKNDHQALQKERICNPGKFAFHTRLRNETVPWEHVIAQEDPSFTISRHRKMKGNSDVDVDGHETVVNQLVRESIEKYSRSYSKNQPETVFDVGCGMGATLYSLVPLVTNNINIQQAIRKPSRRHAQKVMLDYTCIGMNSPELNTARVLAGHHLEDLIHDDLVNVTFVQGDLESGTTTAKFASLGSNIYTTVTAIESLSHLSLHYLESWLLNVYRSLVKGGLMILVDDVLLTNNPVDPMTHESRRRTLMRHEEWMELLEGIGYTVVESRDLTLEYEVPPADEDLRPLEGESSFVRKKKVLQFMTSLVGKMAFGVNNVWPTRLQSWARLLELQQASNKASMMNEMRMKDYRDAERGYNMYILRKKK